MIFRVELFHIKEIVYNEAAAAFGLSRLKPLRGGAIAVRQVLFVEEIFVISQLSVECFIPLLHDGTIVFVNVRA